MNQDTKVAKQPAEGKGVENTFLKCFSLSSLSCLLQDSVKNSKFKELWWILIVKCLLFLSCEILPIYKDPNNYSLAGNFGNTSKKQENMFLKNYEHFLFINIHFLFLFLATDIYNSLKNEELMQKQFSENFIKI